jgi:hypothetical protein
MRKTTKTVLRGLAASAIATGGLAFTSPAHAATTLTVGVDCGSGGNYYSCTSSIVGGQSPLQIDWYSSLSLSGAMPAYHNQSEIAGSCKTGTVNVRRIVVTDVTGATASASRSFLCRSGPIQ